MKRRWPGLAAGIGAGLLVAAVSWLAVDPVEGCMLLPSLPPQGACESRLGTITPLAPGETATPLALLTGAAAAGLIWALVYGSAWRRRVTVVALVALGLGLLTTPTACEWVIPAGRMLHPDDVVRRCTNLAGVTTGATRPQDAAVASIAAGLVSLMAIWLFDRHAQSQRRSTTR